MRRALLALLLLLGFASCREKHEVWKALPLATSADFRGVHFADPQHGWIVGGGFDIPGGLIGRTSDGGKNWAFSSGILSESPRATGLKVEAVHFFDERRGVVATDGGKVYVTSDGGENWGEVRAWTGSTDYLFDLHFLDDRTGWAVGLDGVLQTVDGGRHWVPLARDNDEEKIAGRAITFLDRKRGWFIGQHGIAMSSVDGGRNWTQARLPLPKGERPDFWDLAFVDGREGWITGEEGTLLHTNDGGKTWSRRELGIEGVRSAPKLERIQRGNKIEMIDAGDRTPGLTLASISFADAQHGWIAGFYANLGRSLILRTTDGGTTWTIEADIEGEELRRLFALDRNHVWAIGQRTRPGTQAIYFRDPAAK
jgi:photosystem II stability/assembly factor-like uncharacterized protein